MAEDEVRIEHPNREKAASRATKAVVILLLLVSAALVAIVTIGGWDALEGANGPLKRLGSALAKLPGKVLVVGYTDGSDPPTARTPSAWHQAMEWARGAADVLRPQVGDTRLAIEARVDTTAGQPPRRVEIILFPQ